MSEKMKPTRKELKRQIEILKADNLFNLSQAHANIGKCGQDRYMGSGVAITVRNINKENNVICEEFLIADGLSPETIEAIKNDIKRSYELKLSLIPKLK